mmetsp:Transcript_1790/g.3143  ORF Transcript_1790/g.3143 Transcript_1790/m.3143 type:complete len:228 (-) Transcript_1790:408-1091(-)
MHDSDFYAPDTEEHPAGHFDKSRTHSPFGIDEYQDSSDKEEIEVDHSQMTSLPFNAYAEGFRGGEQYSVTPNNLQSGTDPKTMGEPGSKPPSYSQADSNLPLGVQARSGSFVSNKMLKFKSKIKQIGKKKEGSAAERKASHAPLSPDMQNLLSEGNKRPKNSRKTTTARKIFGKKKKVKLEDSEGNSDSDEELAIKFSKNNFDFERERMAFPSQDTRHPDQMIFLQN